MYLTGSFVMRHTFPQFGDESVRLLKILIWLFPSETISCLTRPFVYQFFPVKFIPIINLISFIAILALALAIIPGYGASGAAWGYVIVNSFTALLWVGICLKRPLKHNIVGDAIQ
jgi:O-antigen/teichoic acid export membrane protein